MKKLIIFFLIIACSTSAVFAGLGSVEPQRGDGNKSHHAQLNAMKMGFFSQKLELTDSQNAEFWPIYMKYSNEKRDLMRKKRDIFKKMRSSNEVSQTDIDGFLNIDKQFAELDKLAVNEYKSVLSLKQIAGLFVAEEEFKEFLLKSFSKENKGKSGAKLMMELQPYK